MNQSLWLVQAIQGIIKEAKRMGEKLETVYISGEPAPIFFFLVL